MISHEQAKFLLTRGVETGLILAPQIAEQTYSVSYFAFGLPQQSLPPDFSNLSVSIPDRGTRYARMEAITNGRLHDRVLLGGWERRGRSGAALMLVEREEVTAQESRGRNGVIHRGKAFLGRTSLSDLNVYFPSQPLPKEMMEDPLVMELLAQAAKYSTVNGVNWSRFANLPGTPPAAREVILSQLPAR